MTVTTRPHRVASPTSAPVAPVRLPEGGEIGIGQARAWPLRREGPAKLTGTALYTDDMVFPGAWYGHTVRSTDAHARLLGIDLDPDFDWSRVVVLTAKDIPGDNLVSLIADDQPVLVDDKIRHHAEPVALLAAPDQTTLREAKRRISLRTEPLAAVFDPLQSEQEFAHFALAKGDVESGLAEAELIIEGTYRVGHQEQLYIENNAMIAVPRPDGGVTIHGSMQCPYYIHKALKRALRMTGEQAVVVQAETGGGFGGKEEYPSVIAIHAALLAQRIGKPVRMIYDRHEDLAATTKRHPAIVNYRTGVMRDGRLVAQDIEVIMDGGAYSTLTPVVLSRGTLHAGGPYVSPNVRIRGRAMATNTPPNGAFRGFGAPQTEFAAEMQVNRIADELGISPLELRRRWVYRLGDETPSGQILRESVAGEEVLERAAEAAEFERIRGQTGQARAVRQRSDMLSSATERTARGIGLAMAWHGAGFTGSGEVKLASVASVELTSEGEIRVLTASTEMGQGTKTIFPQLAAEQLGIAVEDVRMAPQDTSIVPDSGPTVASRTAMVVGGLVIQGSARLRERVEQATGRPFAESYGEYAREHGALRIDQQFEPYPNVDFDDETYRGDAYPAYGWAAATAEVEVDLDTGEVVVRSVISADDIGKAIHPVLAEGQVEGGTLQAVGYATIEEIKLTDGRYLNDRLATYLIPTALDAPRIEAILVENPFSGAPHGAKGVGELPMDVPAAAVVAAIHDATGVWIHDLPASPERILAALHGIAPPPPPGISTVSPRSTRPAPSAANAGAPDEGLDPRPEASTDPQPLRGPQP
ncbi:xanthine dehydrogenase family protein molybdopterin-binding subunit [soil metagenome]